MVPFLSTTLKKKKKKKKTGNKKGTKPSGDMAVSQCDWTIPRHTTSLFAESGNQDSGSAVAEQWQGYTRIGLLAQRNAAMQWPFSP
jgi:hypothetical protein